VTALRKSTPPQVAAAVAQALEKLPADRFATANDFAAALHGHVVAGAQPLASAVRGPVRDRWRTFAAGAGIAALGFAALFLWSLVRGARAPSSDAPIVLTFRPAARLPKSVIAISPDGRRIVLSVPDSSGATRLVTRDLGSPDIIPIPGSDGGSVPAFSPDGHWLLFRTGALALKKIPVSGGTAVTLVDSLAISSGWAANGWILFGAVNRGLWRVRESGGAPERLTQLDTARREFAHAFPQELPGGKAAIFNNFSTPFGNSRIDAVEYATRRITPLVEGAIFGRYLDGYLLFVRDGTIFAAPFDAGSLRVRGPAVPVVEDVAWIATDFSAGYAVSPNGTLAYLKASEWATESRVVWIDRSGNERPAVPLQGQWAEPRLSPDGRWVALTRLDPSRQVWLFDRTRQVLSQLTHSVGVSFDPVWTPDSRALIHIVETPVYDLAKTAIDGSTSDTILRTPDDKAPSAVSPDGMTIAYAQRDRTLLVPLSGTGRPKSSDSKPGWQNASFSPDGRWIAYQQAGTEGKLEVYVQRSNSGGRQQVSASGGSQPRWTRGGREIDFRNGDAVYAATFQPATGEIGAPVLLFRKPDAGEINDDFGYDVTPDGSQFIMVEPVVRPAAQPVVVVVNWLEELKKKVPR
jgi:Tol biopolymer transport system component